MSEESWALTLLAVVIAWTYPSRRRTERKLARIYKRTSEDVNWNRRKSE